MKLIRNILFVTFVFYMGGAIFSSAFNPFKWEEIDRHVIVAFWIICVIAAYGFTLMESEKRHL